MGEAVWAGIDELPPFFLPAWLSPPSKIWFFQQNKPMCAQAGQCIPSPVSLSHQVFGNSHLYFPETLKLTGLTQTRSGQKKTERLEVWGPWQKGCVWQRLVCSLPAWPHFSENLEKEFGLCLSQLSPATHFPAYRQSTEELPPLRLAPEASSVFHTMATPTLPHPSPHPTLTLAIITMFKPNDTSYKK